MTTRRRPLDRSGFSLAELLVVITIIVLVLAILLPVLGNARNAAKKAATAALMNSLTNAAQSFMLDKSGKLPGYFSAGDMGSSSNENAGMSGMKNILLDLAGGITQANANGSDILSVGPGGSGGTVRVDTKQIGGVAGGSTKAYFAPDRANLVVQEAGTGVVASGADNAKMPDLVDNWGNPILAWVGDERQATKFASRTSDSETAKFYWASNACYLKATGLGKSRKSQVNQAAGNSYSLIGANSSGGTDDVKLFGSADGLTPGTMHALLGNPGFLRTKANANDPDYPASARGSIVFHSAGADGLYLGSTDRGGKIAIGSKSGANIVEYRKDLDAINDFDDVLGKAGN